MRADEKTAAKLKAIKRERALRTGETRKGPPLAVIIAHLRRLFADRYGRELPDNDAGRDCAWIIANCMAHRKSEAGYYIAMYLGRSASWMEEDERESLIERVLDKPLRFTADWLAQRLNVTEEERTRLGITTIGSIEKTSAERKAERKERKRVRDRRNKEHQRRTEGRKPRAQSLSKTQPWKAAGISRRAWYYRRQAASHASHSSH
jgi:hypothetical protein